MIPNEVIIIGGGYSIKDGLSQGLKDKIKDKFVITINYAYKHFDSTFTSYVDYNPTKQSNQGFYEHEYDKIDSLPLLIGTYRSKDEVPYPNTLRLYASGHYNRDLRDGVYRKNLAGVFTLSLAIYLIDKGNIYLLGYDYGKLKKNKNKKKFNRNLTHYYQGEINHRGIGKDAYYNSPNKQMIDFGYFQNEEKCKIIVVGDSNLTLFPNISYEEFFKRLSNSKYNQKRLRKEIIKKTIKCKALKKGDYFKQFLDHHNNIDYK